MSFANVTFWEEFIEQYKRLPQLWQIKSDLYHNKQSKINGYNKLKEKLSEIEKNATIDMVKRKINNLRGCYRREFKKVRQSAKSGAGVDDLYVPTLWYFKKLHFLQDQECQLDGISSDDVETGNEQMVEKKEDVAWEEMHVNDGDDDSESDGGNSLFSEITQNKLQRKFYWTREGLAIFIKLFKGYPVLYDPNHKNYKNRPRREDARNKLLNDMKHVDPTISLHDVCVKINCLRCQYSRELRRIVAAKKTNTTYKPKLWCFDELSYLNNSDVIIKPLHEYDNDDESQTVYDNSTVDHSEEIYNNDNTINNETMEEEQIQEMIDEDEIEYDETLLKCQRNSISEKKSKLKIKKNLPTESYKGTKRKKPTDSQDGKYEWLSDLVAAQMEEISPTFRADFAWDVQCLIRKYILKTKAEAEAEAPDKSPKDAEKNKSSQDLVLPRSSNVSLNIRFL